MSSAVLQRLGEELITNHIQALAELIKNAYDADATVVRVEIDTKKLVEDPKGTVRRGLIRVADNGFGMDEDAVRNGWLRVSASPKRDMKATGKKTPKKRTPLGDKGLGRLGAQRLGDRVRIRTRPEPRDSGAKGEAYEEHDVSFAFSDFRADLDVNKLRVPWTTYHLPDQEQLAEPWPVPKKSTGTVLEISGLTNPDDWEDTQALERSLSLLANPFKGVEKFRVIVRVDGRDLNLESVASQVRDAALIRWEGTFDGETLSVEGQVRLGWFNVRDRAMRERLEELTAADKGVGVRDFVLDAAQDGPFSVTPGRGQWLLKLKREFTLEDLDFTGLPLIDVEDVSSNGASSERQVDNEAQAGDAKGIGGGEATDKDGSVKRPVSPGEFLFELDVLSRRIGVARASGFSALDRQSQYTEWLNERGGVHVYRDGFRINLGSDVMDLGEAFSSSSSYYGLRPQNVLGYIEISAEHNPGLEETTDREGFRETPEVITFWRIVHTIRDEINDVLDVLGRAANSYVRSQMAPEDETTEELADELAEAAQQAVAARVVLATARDTVHSVSTAVDPAPDDTTRALANAEEALAAADAALEHMDAAQRLGTVVRHDIVELSEREAEYAQLIGLGLVAETLAHELHHVTSRLSGQVSELQSRTDLPPWAHAYLQDARSAMDALHGHLRHLDPMLRYARTRREPITLDKFAREMCAFHAQRLREKRIEIKASASHAATVTANRGRLMQVFDNLLINSEYWLEQALRARRIARGEITVNVSGRTITVSDNGPGVDPKLERTIFDPFVTAKADRGRGLGLFISRQLLDLDGATIELAEHRNDAGRADTFEISFKISSAEANG